VVEETDIEGVCLGRRNDTSIVAFGVPAMQKRRQVNTTMSGNLSLTIIILLAMLIIQSASFRRL